MRRESARERRETGRQRQLALAAWAVVAVVSFGCGGESTAVPVGDDAGPSEDGGAEPPDGCTHFVTPGGDDAADGSWEAPWRTPTLAVDLLAPGDTLCVREGTYVGMVEIAVSGEPGAPITVAGFPGERPTIDARGPAGFLLGCGIHHVTIRGFEIRGFSPGGGIPALPHPAGIVGYCEDTGRTAVSDSAFLENVIVGTRGAGQEGIWLRASPRNLVAGNVIRDLGSSAVRVRNSAGCTVFSNLAHDVGLEDPMGGGITFYCSPDTDVSFNTVVMLDAQLPPAILLFDGGEGCEPSEGSRIHHDVAVRIGERREVSAAALNVQARNAGRDRDLDLAENLWWAGGRWSSGTSDVRCPESEPGSAPVVLWGSDGDYQGGCWLSVAAYRELTGRGAGDMEQDPAFEDLAARDFRLRPGSPASGAATLGDRERDLLEALGRELPESGQADLGYQFPATRPEQDR